MAVPKKKTSQARRNQRRAHHAISGPGLVACPNCGEPHVPHRVCRECGYYKGRTAVAVEDANRVRATTGPPVRIAVDALGGDNAPREVVAGAVAAARGLPHDEIVLVGEPEADRA